jgi:hypothetical protein
VSLLDRATSHIRYLESVNDQLEKRLQIAEAEVNRLRSVNETLMINTAKRAAAATSNNPSANLLQPTAFWSYDDYEVQTPFKNTANGIRVRILPWPGRTLDLWHGYRIIYLFFLSTHTPHFPWLSPELPAVSVVHQVSCSADLEGIPAMPFPEHFGLWLTS